jgi:hypothetical protein
MAKRRAAGISCGSVRDVDGDSDGTKALSRWSNHGGIIMHGISGKIQTARKNAMPLRHAAYGPSSVSFEQSTSEKMTKLIRKLRWSGFEKEADWIQLVLDGVAQDQSSLACLMTDLRILRVVGEDVEGVAIGGSVGSIAGSQHGRSLSAERVS